MILVNITQFGFVEGNYSESEFIIFPQFFANECYFKSNFGQHAIWGNQTSTGKSLAFCNIQPNMHKRNHQSITLNAKKNLTCPNKGVGYKFQKAQIMEIKGNIFTLPIKIVGCCCLHEQAIQSILTIPMHLDSKQI